MNLISSYLADEASLWRNVQETSTRVKDPVLLGELAGVSLNLFSDRYIRASALTCVLYSIVEGSFPLSGDALRFISDFTNVAASLSPQESRKDCRWFVSLHLARTAYSINLDRAANALDDLSTCLKKQELAFSYGQFFTNIVKSALLKVVVTCASGQDSRNLLVDVDEILGRSNVIPQNCGFLNKWAYEEVVFVYAMLCELYKWRSIVLGAGACLTLADLEVAGFKWRFVGAPFGRFYKS